MHIDFKFFNKIAVNGMLLRQRRRPSLARPTPSRFLSD
ncbi:hypothetical protein BSIN_0319 [Burkholderia singularis]|uniref:Uncharacterized protein n=1 Tax=Burkholderia singularis TaxID=1503053 RepID=A0A238H4L5_9BURK|nr:hypothetical protein BSIN_0319 [Burkholderia singularis]